MAILDPSATSHFLVTDASTTGMPIVTSPIIVTISDGSKLTSTNKQELDLPLPPQAAQSGHIIPGISSYSLMSVVTLCNVGCRMVFEEWGIVVTVTFRGNIVIGGNLCSKTGLSLIPTTNKANL